MTDLSLNEFRDIPEHLVNAMIKEEKRKMSGADFLDKPSIIKPMPNFSFFRLLRCILYKPILFFIHP